MDTNQLKIDFQNLKKQQGFFGKFEVKLNGDINYDNDRYIIHGKRLNEEDWALHMSEKNWCNMNDFLSAFLQAHVNVDKKSISFKLSY